MNPLHSNSNEILTIRFSHSCSHFILGLSHGFSVYESQPLKEILWLELRDSNFELVDIFDRGLYALIGNGRSTQFPNNKVSFWEEKLNGIIQFITLLSPILNVKMNADFVIIATCTSISIYRILDMAFIDQISTFQNPAGLLDISMSSEKNIAAFPGTYIGLISLVSCKRNRRENEAMATTIAAHSSEVTALKLNYEGTILLSLDKSERFILLWDSITGEKIFKIRKEREVGILCCTAFSEDDFYVALTYSAGITYVHSLATKTRSCSDSDHEENCVDALAFHFFDNLFCGLVSATLPSEEESDSSFARLYSTSPDQQESAQNSSQHSHFQQRTQQDQFLGGRAVTVFSNDSPRRLLQLSLVGNVLIRYDFQDGGEIVAANQPPLHDGAPIFNKIVLRPLAR